MNYMEMMIQEYEMIWEDIKKLEEELEEKKKTVVELGGHILEELMEKNKNILIKLKEG